MKFRTEIEAAKPRNIIGHDTPLLLVGSCFSDNMGARLERDGFNVVYNPLGPLYNPVSIARVLHRALDGRLYTPADMVAGSKGWHCLDFASRYCGTDADALAQKVNDDFRLIVDRLHNADFRQLIVTFGSAWVFERQGQVVGNCHKFAASEFVRRRLSLPEIIDCWSEIINQLPHYVNIIFTVSPIRHTADGLHGNEVSKATLLLAIDELCRRFPRRAEYFPAYEIMIDDLRDYRFYAADMKHPSDVAADYIYDYFSTSYITARAREAAIECRRAYLASMHRPIL